MYKMNLQKRSPAAVSWWAYLSLVAAVGLVQAQLPTLPGSPTTPVPPPPATTTTTTSTTTSSTTTTTTSTTTTSSTIEPTPPPSSSPVTESTSTFASPTSFFPPPASSTIYTVPETSTLFPTSFSGTLASGSPLPTQTATTTKDSSNVPVIVGSVAGVAAVMIIVATTIICYRRRRRNTRELTFDTLQGMSASGANNGGARASQRYNTPGMSAAALPVVGRASTTAGYDDPYDYETQSNVGPGMQAYGTQHLVNNGGGYGSDIGYDAYGTPQSGYQNPSIFQEDSLTYSSGSVGRNRGAGYDPSNLPEIVYRNGNEQQHPSGDATGYYEDNMYNHQAGWNQNLGGGYIGPKGLWVANPSTEGSQYQQDYQHAGYDYPEVQHASMAMEGGLASEHIEMQSPMGTGSGYEKNSINQYDNLSDTVVGSASSPRSKFRGHNPQTLPESPRLQQLRGGDLFGQDGQSSPSGGAAAVPSSPRAAAVAAAFAGVGGRSSQDGSRSVSPPLSSSPRLLSRGDMRSFEMARHSPGRSSGEGIQSYATDYAASRPSASADRPSLDRPSLDNSGNGSGGTIPHSGKSLRTQRREDWS